MEALKMLAEGFPDAARDIRLNLGAVLAESSLSEGQRWLCALSCAFATKDHALARAVITAGGGALDEARIDDARAVAVLMAMNNVYYRFRHMVGKEAYAALPARLRMNRLALPKTGKLDFELASLSVSALNGCELCVKSHEKVLVEHGVSEAQVHDAARIAAVIAASAQALDLAAFDRELV